MLFATLAEIPSVVRILSSGLFMDSLTNTRYRLSFYLISIVSGKWNCASRNNNNECYSYLGYMDLVRVSTYSTHKDY